MTTRVHRGASFDRETVRLVHAPSHRLRLRLSLLLLALCASPVFGADGLDDPGGYASIPFDLDFTPSDFGRACAAQSDGKVLLAGSATDGDGEETKIGVARLRPDGLLDQSFGSDGLGGGRVVITLSEQGVQALRGQALALAVDPHERVRVAGTMDRKDNSESIGFVTRQLSDGRIDPVWFPAGW